MIYTMEEDGMIKSNMGSVGNYSIFIELENQKVITIILLSSLDDSVYQTSINDQTMPENCQKLYNNVEELYEYIQSQINNQNTIKVSDIGGIVVTDFAERKGKKISIESFINCTKIIDKQIINKLYLKFIRLLQSKEKAASSLIKNQKLSIKESIVQVKRQQELEQIIKKHHQCKQIQLSIDKLNNPYLHFFNIFKNRVTIQQFSRTRIKLFFHQVIPKQGCYYVSVRIVNLKANAFSIGIIDRDEDRNWHRSPYSFAFQFYTRQLKDTFGKIQNKQSGWRPRCESSTDLRGALLRMEINMDQQRLLFYCNNKKVGETIISNYLMERPLIAYINCKHLEDQFIFNQN